MSRPRPKQLNRRSFLKGTGTLIALPFLEAMLPQSAQAQSAAMPKRMGVFYFPLGTHTQAWWPTTFGTNFNIPTNLNPIAPFKSRVILTKGLGAHGLPQGSHMASAPYFIGEPINNCQFQVRSKTADALISDYLRQSNASLLPLNAAPSDISVYSGCGFHGTESWENGIQTYLSWTGTTSAASQMTTPQQVFDKLFAGAGSTMSTSDPLLAFRRSRGLSVLDSILGQATSLNNKIGTEDRQKMDQYFTSIREVERTLRASSVAPVLTNTCNPGSRPASNMPFDQELTVFMDLAVLAMACDKSRVITHLMDFEGDRKMPWLGIDQIGVHQLSHFESDYVVEGRVVVAAADKPALYLRATNWYADRLAYLLGKMQAYKEGDRDLLYNSVIIYGSGMGPTGNHHDQTDLPIVIAGELGGTIRTGQAIDASGTRMANLYLSIMQKFGMNIGSYASSTGSLNLG